MDVFSAWYYSFSPSVAGFIASNEALRAPVRAALYPLLAILGLSAFVYSTLGWAPEFAVVMAGLVASSLIGLVYLTPSALVGVWALRNRKGIRATSIAKGSVLLLALALAALTLGEVIGSYVLLALGSLAIVLVCIAATPAIAALAMLRPDHN